MMLRMWSNCNSRTFLVGIQTGVATLENSLKVSYKVKHSLSIQAKTIYLGIYPRKMTAYVQKSSMQMYTEASFVIAPNWKHSNYLLIHEWINKLQHINRMEYTSSQHQRQ